jgi:hypothetical protein
MAKTTKEQDMTAATREAIRTTSVRSGEGMRRRRTASIGLAVIVVLLVGSTAWAQPPGAVIAPADDVTIEILQSNSAFVNHIHLFGPGVDLGVTDDDTGETRQISTRTGREIKFEIRPFHEGELVAGPWRSGPGDRNSDGEVHARVTANSDGSCLLVEFEDTDGAGWADDPDEPNYVDAIFWVYPSTTPGFDTSSCQKLPIHDRRSSRRLGPQPNPQRELDGCDGIEDGGDRRTGEKETHRVVGKVENQATRVSPGRHVGGHDLVAESGDLTSAKVDVDGGTYDGHPPGSEIGGATCLLHQHPHRSGSRRAGRVADPVDIAVQHVEGHLGYGSVDIVAGPIELDRDVEVAC